MQVQIEKVIITFFKSHPIKRRQIRIVDLSLKNVNLTRKTKHHYADITYTCSYGNCCLHYVKA